MKIFSFLSVSLVASAALCALPMRNPASPRLLYEGVFCSGTCPDVLFEFWKDPCYDFCHALSVRVGYQGNFVFNRHLELENQGGGDLRKSTLMANNGILTLSLFDQFDLYATLGVARVGLVGDSAVFGSSTEGDISLVSSSHFCWGIGGAATLYEWGCFNIGAEIDYFKTRPAISHLAERALFTSYPPVSITYQEWQAGVSFSYRIHFMVPYIGVKWGHVWVAMNDAVVEVDPGSDPLILHDLESKKRAGMAIGTTVFVCQRAAGTIEARFGDEKGLATTFDVRF